VGDKPLIKSSGWLTIAIGSAIALAVAGLGFFSYTVLRPRPTASEGTTTTSSSANAASAPQNAITALGRLQAGFNGPLKIAAPSTFGNSRVLKLLVKEGAIVKAGQPVAVMDSYPALSAAVAQAQAQGMEAQARLEQVKAGAKQGDIIAQRADIPDAEAGLRKATQEFNKAKWEYERYKVLAEQGAVSQLTLTTQTNTYKQAEQSLQQAQQRLERSQAELTSIQEVRPTDINQAEAQVQVAMANFRKAQVEQENAIVRSSVDGQVLKIHTYEGETVDKEGILEIGDTAQMFAIAEVDETDVSRVQLGKQATITGDAFRGETITGTVVDVGRTIGKKAVLNTDPVDKVDTRVVEVRVRLDDSKKVASFTNLQVKVAISP
jgi:HlyD family secretion protein